MSSTKLIPVVFDVLGTCFSFDAASVALTTAFGNEFAAAGVKASSVVDDWFHSSQRDFTVRLARLARTRAPLCVRLLTPAPLPRSTCR